MRKLATIVSRSIAGPLGQGNHSQSSPNHPGRLSGVGETRSGVLQDKAKSPTGDRSPGNTAGCLSVVPGSIAPYCRGSQEPAMIPSRGRGCWRRADGIDQPRLAGTRAAVKRAGSLKLFEARKEQKQQQKEIFYLRKFPISEKNQLTSAFAEACARMHKDIRKHGKTKR
ncbi:hypothetical protein TcCL_NonESM03676 [Trypanosoma cruzi]|nr:hypothetical protein TcCL_NonESM03676 [Trypanosoma cruzi]